jgi:hypothetical protein
MIIMRKTIFLFSLLQLLILPALAQNPPEQFQYQAVARDAAGAILANQNVGIQISILETTSTGPAVYIESHNVSTNQFGLLTLEIGAGVPSSGTFSSISWGGNQHFVQLEMDETGGTNYQMMGVSQLLAVPYAMHAKTVENETQDISLSGTDLSITNGSTIDLSVIQDGVTDADADASNELQTLSFDGATGDLTISNGNFVTLPINGSGGDNWGSQTVQTDGVTITGDGTGGNQLSVIGDLTDDQNLTLTGTDLQIDNGNTVDLSVLQDGVTDADDDPTNENQSLTVSGTDLSISNGNTVDLSVLQDGVTDADADPINEIQALSISGSDLTISGGNTVTLPAGGNDNWGTDVVNSGATLTGDGTSGNPLDVVGDLTDDQNLSLSGTDLQIDNGNTVDLSVLQDGVTDADANPTNEIQSLSLSGSDLTISGGNTVTLPSGGGADNWGTDVVNSNSTLTGDGTSGNPLGVNGDLTDDQTLSLSSNTLAISGGNNVDLSPYLDNTDGQSLSISGNDLTISGGNTVTLPSGGSSPWSTGTNTIYETGSNIGIGTTSPTYPLHIHATGLNPIGFYQTDGSMGIALSMESLLGNSNMGTTTNHDFSLMSNNTTRMTVDKSGNIGIGVLSPEAPLTINTGTSYGVLQTNGSVKVGSYASTTSGQYGTKSNHDLGFFTNNNVPQMTLTTGGNVGIGTSSPAYKLVVEETGFGIIHTNGTVDAGSYLSSSRAEYGTRTNHDLGFFTNNSSPHMVVTTSGNVGVGTTSPSQKFYVNGNAHVEGDLTWKAKTSYTSLGPADFANPGQYYDKNLSPGWTLTPYNLHVVRTDSSLKWNNSFAPSDFAYFQASIKLPDGATLQEVTLVGTPGNSGGETLGFWVERISLSNGTVELMGTGEIPADASNNVGAGTISTWSTSAVIDHSSYRYQLGFSVNPFPSVAQQCVGAKIKYTTTTVH